MDAPENEMKEEMGTEEKDEHSHAIKHSLGLFARKSPVSKLAELLNISSDFRESFEQEISELSGLTSKVMNRESFKEFGDTIEDDQEIHRSEEAAKSFSLLKLETTPAFGVLTMAFAEGYANRLLSKINLYAKEEFVYNGVIVRFKQPLYPGEEIVFQLEDSFKAEKETKGINLNMSGVTKDAKRVVNLANLCLRHERPEPGKTKFPLCPSSEEIDMIYHRRIDSSRLGSYFSCLGEPRRDEITMALALACAPAAALKFSKEKGGRLEGVYMSIDSEFYNPPHIGDFKTFVQFQDTKKKRGLYYHNFLAWCFQEEEPRKPIFSAKLVCASQTKID